MPQAKRPIAVSAVAAKATTVLSQEAPPGRSQGMQQALHRRPGSSRVRDSWVRPAEHPLDLAQVRFHALP
ncbi:MAG: hypothetical protein ACRDS0_21995 [Pseudonocardiaceae bacterium]